jgi:hypothetical protein
VPNANVYVPIVILFYFSPRSFGAPLPRARGGETGGASEWASEQSTGFRDPGIVGDGYVFFYSNFFLFKKCISVLAGGCKIGYYIDVFLKKK